MTVRQEYSDRTVRSGTHYSGRRVRVSTPDNLYMYTEHGFIPSLSRTQNSINGVSYGIDVLDDVVVVVENKYDMPPNNRAFRSMAGGPSTKKRPRGGETTMKEKQRIVSICFCELVQMREKYSLRVRTHLQKNVIVHPAICGTYRIVRVWPPPIGY